MAHRILIVDDEKDMVTVLKKRLVMRGYEVGYAENGREAMTLIENDPVDLIILDIMMPVMGGPELANILKENPLTRNIPIIFLSAILDRSEKSQGISGGRPIFAKPFDTDELVAAIEKLLKK